MTALVLTALLYPPSASAIDATVSGDCPGPMRIDIVDLTGPSIALFRGPSVGSAPIPGGPCRDVDLGLEPARFVTTARDSDGDGQVRLTPRVSALACDSLLQVVDLETCELSEPRPLRATLPQLVAADGRRGEYGSSFYTLDLDTGAVEPHATGLPLTALTYAPDGALWGVEANGCDGARLYTIDPATGAATLEHTVDSSRCWSGMTWSDGVLYHWAEDGDRGLDNVYAFDPDTGEDRWVYAGGASYGACMAADATGRIYRLAGMSLYTVDPLSGTEDFVGNVTGIITDLYSTGTGCTFHEGQLYLAATGWISPTSLLYTVDLVTLEATDTGIAIPSAGWDALASSTP